MDERDFRILLELKRDPFASHEKIGRTIGVGGKAVKQRLDALQQKGIYSGIAMVPHGAIFGLESRVFAFDLPPDGPWPEPGAIHAVPGVASVGFSYPNQVAAIVYTEQDEPEPSTALANAIGGKLRFSLRLAPLGAQAQKLVPLSRIELRVLEALLPDPCADLKDVATAAAVTPRTARAAREKFRDAKLADFHTRIDARKDQGDVVYYFYVATESRDLARSLHFEDCEVIHVHDEPPGVLWLGHAPNYAAALGMEAKARAMPGVRDVLVTVPVAVYNNTPQLITWTRIAADRFRATP